MHQDGHYMSHKTNQSFAQGEKCFTDGTREFDCNFGEERIWKTFKNHTGRGYFENWSTKNSYFRLK